MRRQIGSKKRRGLRLERFEQREMLTGIDELLAEILRLRNAQASELESEESVSEDHSSRDLVIASLGLFGAGLVINEFAVDSRESQKSQASLRKRRPR